MATTIEERRIASTHEHNGAAPAAAVKPVEWGNSAPLALAAFAVTTFMLSMINATSSPRTWSRRSSASR